MKTALAIALALPYILGIVALYALVRAGVFFFFWFVLSCFSDSIPSPEFIYCYSIAVFSVIMFPGSLVKEN